MADIAKDAVTLETSEIDVDVFDEAQRTVAPDVDPHPHAIDVPALIGRERRGGECQDAENEEATEAGYHVASLRRCHANHTACGRREHRAGPTAMRALCWVTAGLMLALPSAPSEAQDTSATPEVRKVLAPTGRLRVGLYVGNPSSLLLPVPGRPSGVGFELGRELARWLDVSFEPMVYPNNGAMLEGMRLGNVDVVFTNATPARAKEMDFTQPYLEVEAGYLVPEGPRSPC